MRTEEPPNPFLAVNSPPTNSAVVLKSFTGSYSVCISLSKQWRLEPRGSGGGEEREWSEKTAGGDPPQGDQFNRTILGQLAYKWSSSPDAPTDENTGADCVPRSCRGTETEDDHGESSPSVNAAAAAAAAAPQADIYIMCPPSHKRLGRCCSEP